MARAARTNVLRLLYLADAPQCASGDNYRPKFGVPRGGAVNITCREDRAFAFTTDGVVGLVLTWKCGIFCIFGGLLQKRKKNLELAVQSDGEPAGHRVPVAVQLCGEGVRTEKLRGAQHRHVEHHHLCVSSSDGQDQVRASDLEEAFSQLHDYHVTNLLQYYSNLIC